MHVGEISVQTGVIAAIGRLPADVRKPTDVGILEIAGPGHKRLITYPGTHI